MALTYQNIYPLILQKTRKWFSKKLNPFNLCPVSLTYWIIVPPYNAIGIVLSDLRTITIYWRQQIDPNETSYLNFKVFEMKPPFPLTLLVLFSGFGITISDAAFRVFQETQTEHDNQLKNLDQSLELLSNSPCDLQEEVTRAVAEEKRQSLVDLLDPFRLTPRLSIFFPISEYTSMGFLTIDFRHIEYSMAQSMEPNGNVEILFRFLDFYTPFPLQITTMMLSVGLFVTGAIYKYSLEASEELIDGVKQTLK